MNKLIFLFSFNLFFCQGHLVATESIVTKGTLFFNVTGLIQSCVGKPQDILDRESDVHNRIARNLTRGFGKLFPNKYQHVLNYTVTTKERFIWPTFPEQRNNICNLTFVIIAQYKYNTTRLDHPKAGAQFGAIFWNNVQEAGQDGEGYINSEGLRVNYLDDKLIPEPMLDNVTFGYMAFITKLQNSFNGGGVPTITLPTKNSSEEKDCNSSGIKNTGPSESRDHEITYIAYIGITLSIIGLLITMTSICFFRKLRKFRRNQILVHICGTIMAGMLLSILSFTYKGVGDTYCTGLALLLHYFILAAISWMCIEAYNLYRDVVKVFNTHVISSKGFTLRACIFGYGLPALIVGITSCVDISVYGQRNDACWMTSLAFLISFLGPVLFIVFINIVFFGLIMREIVQVSQRDSNNIRPSLRAAISLSVVFGFCWLLAGISSFTSNAFVTYAFVIMSSFQGLFIFIFHGIGKQELRDSWKKLPIFNWQFSKFSNIESQGRGKTESTTQDTPQVIKRHSPDNVHKMGKDYITGLDVNFRSVSGYNLAYAQDNGLGTNGNAYNIPGVPEREHGPLKKTESIC